MRRWSLLSIVLWMLGLSLLLLAGLVGWRVMSVRGQQKLLTAKLAELQSKGVAVDSAAVARIAE